MTSDIWGAFAVATAMWVLASVTLIGADARVARPDGVVWTAASSDKVASHPTLIRRSLAGTPLPLRTTTLTLLR
jgi:hypothetical protein